MAITHIAVYPYMRASATSGDMVVDPGTTNVAPRWKWNIDAAGSDAYFEVKVFLQAGAWQMRLAQAFRGPSYGILKLYVDGVDVSHSIDCYNSTFQDRLNLDASGSFTVTTPGVKTLRFRVNTKNASSTNYRAEAQNIGLLRVS